MLPDRICTRCGLAYRHGQYAAHRLEVAHLRLGIRRRRNNPEAAARREQLIKRRRLVAAMYEAGIRQSEIATALGVSRSAINAYIGRHGLTAKPCTLCQEAYGFAHSPSIAARERARLVADFAEAIRDVR